LTELTVIDFFCGAGGSSVGLEQAGVKIVLAVDNWVDACETYKHNHLDTEVLNQNVLTLDLTTLPKVDFLWFSPPCQEFSRSMWRHRSPTFDLILMKKSLEIIEKLKPRYYVVENVRTIKRFFPTARLLSASVFGVPQNRTRAFISNIPLPPCSIKNTDTLFDTVGGHDAIIMKDEQKFLSIVETSKLIQPDFYGSFFKTKKGYMRVDNDFVSWLQCFPRDYKFFGKSSSIRKQLVNAVPPPLSKAWADAVIKPKSKALTEVYL